MRPIIPLALAFALAALPALAGDGGFRTKQAGDILVRGRLALVLPSDGGDVYTDPGHVDTGLDVDDIDNAVIPELDFSYFFTKTIAAELILGTTPHAVRATGGVDVGDVWLLPPTLTLQYHPLPDERISPYVGAGINYTMFYGEDGGLPGFKVHDTFGFALQAGVDYAIDDAWSLNLDVKQIFLRPEAEAAGLAVEEVRIDPLIVGVGLGYRF